jgi:hypothetical protein
MFLFEPEPYIRRVVFLTTAHRGSKPGAHPGVQLGIGLIHKSNPLQPIWAELEAHNGRDIFKPYLRGRTLSGADGLAKENPMLMALDAQPISLTVTYHSIIANIHHQSTPEKISDGIVEYRSAHLEGAASERIVRATHSCEADREVIEEVRRILHLHLTNDVRPQRVSQPCAQ